MKSPKVALLMLAVAPTMMAVGCGGGFWKNMHLVAIHFAEVVQTAAALNLI